MLDIPASNQYGTGLLKTNPVPVQYRNEAFFGQVLELDYGCRNDGAGFSFLDATAQLGCYCGLLCLAASEGSWL